MSAPISWAALASLVLACAPATTPLVMGAHDAPRRSVVETSSVAEDGGPSWTAGPAPAVVSIDPSQPEVQAPTPEETAERLEMSLLRFTSEIRMVSQRLLAEQRRLPKKDGHWPAPVGALWKQLLDELDDGLAVAPDELMPTRMLLQAHVTTEAERDLAEQRFGPVPSHFKWRIDDLHLTINRLLKRNMMASGRLEPTRRAQIKLAWPLSPVVYTSFYGYRPDPMTGAIKFHTGVDLGASRGVLVNAAAPGRVVFRGFAGGYGRLVVVQHTGGYQTLYAHLDKILVPDSVEVGLGTPLGMVGSSGRSTGPHLHFEVRHGGRPIDPIKALGERLAVNPSAGEQYLD